MHYQFSASSRVFAAISLLLLVVGCGKAGKYPTYWVGGKVSFPDGTPLTKGSVTFRPVDSSAPVTSRGEIKPDGTYELSTFSQGDGATAGRYEVMVMALPAYNARTAPPGSPPPPLLIDSRFSNYSTSGLAFNVTTDPGKNQYDIVVTRPK
jgi:hypothetical protein